MQHTNIRTLAQVAASAERDRVEIAADRKRKTLMALDAMPQQSDIFLGRLPAKPYCSHPSGDLGRGVFPRGQRWARRRPHIQVNPPWARAFIVFDVDQANGNRAWMDADLPMPWWNAINPANGHAHTCYALDAPVLLGDHDRQAPMRYLCAIESAMRERIHGDPAYGGLVTKNPLHKDWNTLTGGFPLTLDEIAEYLPDLAKHKPYVAPETVGLGRNVATFEALRRWAYKAIRDYWGGQRAYVEWQAACVRWANSYSGSEHPTPLDHKECYHLGKSVANWVWKHFDAASFAQRQAKVGRKGGVASGESRRKATEGRDRNIRFLAKHGSQSQRKLAAKFGLSEGAIRHIIKSA